MSVLPAEWHEPGSRKGLLLGLALSAVGIGLFGTLAYAEPYSIAAGATSAELLFALSLGTPIGIVLTYLQTWLERWAARSEEGEVFRFLAGSAMLVGGVAALLVAPTVTVITALVATITMVPTRIFLYLRAS